ncbi:divergent polysaccharide deacetylase family protein [Tabrizicola soli]|uniref:divergent polysaccharide deacetylase family protein n=1 Tax=Tabrizicola soli TaxID=2185115 RepID=UPI0018D356DD|nr:divergent polysaccharide deacetylase family protein [Tabrizicola soli]
MVGKFILGAIFGGVVVTGGLVIGAALFPPPHDTDAANANASPAVSTLIEAPEPAAAPELEAATVEAAPEPAAAEVEAAAEPEAPEPAAAPEPTPAVTDAPPAAPPVTEAAPATQETASAEPSADGSPASAPAPQTPSEPAPSEPIPSEPAPTEPPASETPLAGIAPPEPPEPALPGAVTLAETPAPALPAPALPAEPVQPPAPLAEAAANGAAVTEVEASAPEPAPTPDTLAEAPAPTPEPAAETPMTESAEPELAELLPEPQPPAADPETPASDPAPEPGTDAAGLPGSASDAMPGTRPAALPGTPPAPDAAEQAPATGVITGRLPRIGDAPPAKPEPESAEAAPADDRPIARFAAPFENTDDKPLVAILLIDGGAPELDRAGLAALPFPVSFALDPLDPATPDHAAIYRAAGREVVMLATGLPKGAQPSDVEVAFQSMAQNLPEAVAVMDLAAGGFQNDRPLASLVVPVVQAQGRGLVTWDEGLNAADQVARRADLAATTIFRDLAAGGTDRFALRRTLERVLFKAGQEGRVAVATEATPELVAGLLEWTIEGRGATVALAPLTAVLTVD